MRVHESTVTSADHRLDAIAAISGVDPAMIQFLREAATSRCGSPLPSGMRRGSMRYCFQNSGDAAWRHGLLYCEGIARHPDVPMEVHHAWCMDPKTGRVVDPTWKKPEDCTYLGIAVTLSTLAACQLDCGHYALLDHGRGFETDIARRLLEGQTQAEAYVANVRASARLKNLRRSRGRR
ncbi:hypothetical protein [Tranquillimonas alkanivorans]|uniref:hypothetical protein n=1 Tax=Tranquillimonas alkanivorans TaxID=441119 RepID=UPI0015A6EE3E|nr:hypothetical protein [Tranquillimonas alkanivorans]